MASQFAINNNQVNDFQGSVQGFLGANQTVNFTCNLPTPPPTPVERETGEQMDWIAQSVEEIVIGLYNLSLEDTEQPSEGPSLQQPQPQPQPQNIQPPVRPPVQLVINDPVYEIVSVDCVDVGLPVQDIRMTDLWEEEDCGLEFVDPFRSLRRLELRLRETDLMDIDAKDGYPIRHGEGQLPTPPPTPPRQNNQRGQNQNNRRDNSPPRTNYNHNNHRNNRSRNNNNKNNNNNNNNNTTEIPSSSTNTRPNQPANPQGGNRIRRARKWRINQRRRPMEY
ncbi:hypothetical protein AJ79_10003 [Helicocarpus griseus UAMH5409]|uniref:Uncharacterized protein n=1 Tax=Helicocarpus griseus UAMH5409 TaxID=1447875 RepID=A0A2B7WG29_9EURO|nr:hypothetical protein AJ79_10003 [Helicocarpus griseus UAMH5409]